MFERFDHSGLHVLEAAWHEAASLEASAVSTEHLLLALATADAVTARLLAEPGAKAADLRRVIVATRSPQPGRRLHHDALLATLGVDMAAVRRRAEQTFGADALAQAASRARRPRARRPLWSWISCSKPLPVRRCESPLTGQQLDPIPRVKRVLDRATRATRPRPASPCHLLLALIAGNEPACEVLVALGVDLDALAAVTRRWIDQGGTAGGRAS